MATRTAGVGCLDRHAAMRLKTIMATRLARATRSQTARETESGLVVSARMAVLFLRNGAEYEGANRDA